MTRKAWWIVGALAVLVPGLFVALSGGKSVGDIPAGTGYAAWDLCSRTSNSAESVDQVRTRYIEPKVAPLPLFWQLDIQPKRYVRAQTWLPFLNHPRAALYRKGLGCTLMPTGVSAQQLREQAFVAATQPPVAQDAWPLGEGKVESERLDAHALAAIAHHEAALFGETSDTPRRHQNTTALLIAQDGHLVFERYAQGHGRNNPQLGWSMTKTLTALIAGTLAHAGKLTLDQEVGLSRWKGTPKQAITWRALLNMAPGLAWFEGYGGASDATEMLFSQADQGAWAADRPQTSKPGTVFNYSTGFTNIAMLRMRELLGGTHQAIYDHYQRNLFAPLGIRDGVIEPDASGTPVGGARGFLRPVDWLRLGQLVLNEGQWNGQRVIDKDWIAFMRGASPASPEYGGSIWRQPTTHISASLRARLPKDLVFFAGHLGQFTVIVPSRGLVVLRMGVSLAPVDTEDSTLNNVLAFVAELIGV